MSQPFIGEIRMVGFYFPPINYMLCNGASLSTDEYSALFSLIGTTYGGNGQTTFNLPNLQSRVLVAQGTDPTSGANYILGQNPGTEKVALTANQLPSHTHPFFGSSAAASTNTPTNTVPAAGPQSYTIDANPGSLVALAPNAITGGGNGLPHDNLMPYLCVNFIIAVQGIFSVPELSGRPHFAP